MTQHGGESLDVHSAAQGGGGEGVAEIMEPYLFTLGVFQDQVEPLPDGPRINGAVLLHRGGKHPAGIHSLPVFKQDRQHGRRQNDGADGGFRLGLRDQETVLLGAVDLLCDMQLPGFLVQILPLEGQQLSPPQAGGQLQKEKFKVSLLLCLDQKPLDLLTGQNLHFPRLLGRQFAANGRIDFNKSLVLGSLQRRPAVGVTGTYHAVRQSLSMVIGMDEPPALFQSGVKLLQVVLGQLVQGYFSQFRDDVSIDSSLIAAPGCSPQLRFGVVLIPEVHPVPEGHTGVYLLRFGWPQLFLQLFQLVHAPGFGLTENAFCLGEVLFIIADDYPTLPAAIPSQTDGSLAVFALSSHGFHSSPKMSVIKSPTMPAACFCISPVTWV